MSTIVKALSPEFEDYKMYFLDDGDVAIVAKRKGDMRELSSVVFNNQELRMELSGIGVFSKEDLDIRCIGDKFVLDPFFHSFPSAANSDYFPFLEYEAPRVRFLKGSAGELDALIKFPAPIIRTLLNADAIVTDSLGENYAFKIAQNYKNARAVYEYFNSLLVNVGEFEAGLKPDEYRMLLMSRMRSLEFLTDSTSVAMAWTPYLKPFAESILPYLSPEQLNVIWRFLKNAKGYEFLSMKDKRQLQIFEAAGNCDFYQIINLLKPELHTDVLIVSSQNQYEVALLLWAYIMRNEINRAEDFWKAIQNPDEIPVMLRLLGSMVAQKSAT